LHVEALKKWEADGTTDSAVPSGLNSFAGYPALKCRAIFNCPYGTTAKNILAEVNTRNLRAYQKQAEYAAPTELGNLS
jgi:hypothetical protein